MDRSKAAIVGVGSLKPVRRTVDETTLGLLARAAARAAQDAGLAPDEIDGLLVGPQVGETPEHVPATVAEYLGLRPTMANVCDLGGAAGAGMIWRAAAAIAAGMCETVLCVLGNHRNGAVPDTPLHNPMQEFEASLGSVGVNQSYALQMQAHADRYGCSPEDYALIAHWARANAQYHPDAIFNRFPLSVEEVLDSPIIMSPLHLYEIVMPVAGAEAVIVTSAARARARGLPAVHLLGAGEKVTRRSIGQADELTSGPLKDAMQRAFEQSRTTAADMSLLSLYDCYTIMVAITLEDSGLCPPGRFGSFLREHDLSHTGTLPLNTHGGQLGYGQADAAGGMTHVVEAVHQLRGTAHGRQIANPSLALVTGKGGTMSEAVALVLGADQ